MDLAIIKEFGFAAVAALWSAVGPLSTSAITSWVNSVTNKYVPRPVQIVLSSILTAMVAGVSGQLVGLDPATAAAVGASLGAGSQTFTSLNPRTLLASAPPDAPTAPTKT